MYCTPTRIGEKKPSSIIIICYTVEHVWSHYPKFITKPFRKDLFSLFRTNMVVCVLICICHREYYIICYKKLHYSKTSVCKVNNSTQSSWENKLACLWGKTCQLPLIHSNVYMLFDIRPSAGFWCCLQVQSCKYMPLFFLYMQTHNLVKLLQYSCNLFLQVRIKSLQNSPINAWNWFFKTFTEWLPFRGWVLFFILSLKHIYKRCHQLCF